MPIDMRHVPADGPRPYRFDHGPDRVGMTLGVGNVGARVDGTQLDDRATAHLVRLAAESSAGPAVRLDVFASDDDLFAGRRINDGLAPAAAATRLVGLDCFPHWRTTVHKDVLQVPIRIGPFLDWQRLDHEVARVERDWVAFGPRLVLEPTWRLVERGGLALDVFATLGGDVGVVFFEETFRGGEGSDRTLRLGGELAAGLRVGSGAVQGEIGYRLQHAWIGPTDTELLGDRDHTDLQRQQVFVGFAVDYSAREVTGRTRPVAADDRNGRGSTARTVAAFHPSECAVSAHGNCWRATRSVA
jgi:hypothetical protein